MDWASCSVLVAVTTMRSTWADAAPAAAVANTADNMVVVRACCLKDMGAYDSIL
jgi:hypothetical protein